METVVIRPIKGNRLVVDGTYFKEEDKFGLPAQFLIDSIDIIDTDITDLLEWANSLKSGTVLEEIERLVLEQREFK